MDRDGELTVKKLTTTEDQCRGVVEGIGSSRAARAPASYANSSAPWTTIVHGTTVATNAVLTGRGAQDRA